MASDGINITSAAKTLNVSRSELFDWLQENRWIYRVPGRKEFSAYDRVMRSGLVVCKAFNVERGAFRKMCFQVRITEKGLARLADELVVVNN